METPPATVWNILHDGYIDGLSGTVPGDVTLTVGISYLTAMLPDGGEFLVIRLNDCTKCEYTEFQWPDKPARPPVTSLSELADEGLEILSATDRGEEVEVVTTRGMLRLAYSQVEVQTTSGRTIELDELEQACERYWDDWEQRNKSR